MDVVGDVINLLIAVFTATAAIAAWVSANASQKATEQANREADESRKSAAQSRKIAQEQTDAMMTAAKANALASRINFYTEQIALIEAEIHGAKLGNYVRPEAPVELKELKMQQTHLAFWLDRQTDELRVGLHYKCGSPYDHRVEEWKKTADRLKAESGITDFSSV